MLQESSDQDLVERIRKGSEKELGFLYLKYYPRVYGRCLSMIKNQEEAKDLTQDILLKAFSHLDKFRGQASFSTWLYVITSNHCIEYHRKNKQRYFVDLEQVCQMECLCEDPEPGDENESLMERVASSLEQIPAHEKELLLMRYEQSLSIRDLQLRLHLSPSAVKMRLMRARRKLEKAIPAQKIPA